MRSAYFLFKLPTVTILSGVIGLIIFYCSKLYAAEVTLGWDASSPSPGGYLIYMHPEGQAYDYNSPLWSGTGTTCTIANLSANTYYFVARAFAGGNDGVNSNKLKYKGIINQSPEAYAGMDRTVNASAQVSLDGSGSTDPDGSIASHRWPQTSGPSVLPSSGSIHP